MSENTKITDEQAVILKTMAICLKLKLIPGDNDRITICRGDRPSTEALYGCEGYSQTHAFMYGYMHGKDAAR